MDHSNLLHAVTKTVHRVTYTTTVGHIEDIFQSFHRVLRCHTNSASTSPTPDQSVHGVSMWFCPGINEFISPEKGIAFHLQFPESIAEVNKASSPCYFCSQRNLHCTVPCLVINLLQLRSECNIVIADKWHKQDFLMCLGEILADFYENAATMKDLLRVKGQIRREMSKVWLKLMSGTGRWSEAFMASLKMQRDVFLKGGERP